MERLALKGYEWAALEIDDAETGSYNLSIFDEFMVECHRNGMQGGIWVTEGGNIYKAPGSSEFAIAEIEGPGDYEGVVNVIRGVGAGPLPKCSLATITNFSTLTRDMVKVLVDAKFTCLPEAYMNENPHMTPPAADFTARNLGWATSQPVAGVYPVNGQTADYSQWDNEWPLADYLGEYVI